MVREQFTFYRSFLDGISRIRDKEARCEAYDAIINYALLEVEPDLDSLPDIVQLAFIMVKPIIDSGRRKAEAGKKGGESNTEASAKQNASKREANLNLVKDKDKDKEKDKEELPKVYTSSRGRNVEAFERFWAAYPKKVGKQAAFKVFQRIKGVSVETMLKAVEYQRGTEQWKVNNGQYIPNPATWLNQGRWEDEVATTTPAPVVPDFGDLDALYEELNGLNGA